MPSDPGGANPGTQLPGNGFASNGNKDGVNTPVYRPNASADAEEPPIAAPASFKYLDEQLNKMDYELDDAGNQSGNGDTGPVSTITKATQKIVKHLVIPGMASVGAASIGYVLLFGRTVYSAIAMLMGLGLGGQRLDPATLLDYWERESYKRLDEREKKVESMFE